MRTIGSFVIAISVAASAVPVFASGVEGMEALYVGGSVPQLTAGQRGRLNTTGPDALVFEYAGGTHAIPYASMQRFEYTVPLAKRLGAIPTLAMVLVRYRQRRHLVELQFRDAGGVTQAAVFEVSKDQARPVVAVLAARVPRPVPQTVQPARPPSTR
jgi:hypothetical protein